jgi:glucan endo-1,3-alpha-glucosidase
MPHDAWRKLLPYYIAQYKNPKAAVKVTTEHLIYYYRLTPGKACPNGGTTGNDGAYQTTVDPNKVATDKVFVDAVIKSLPATVTAQIGGHTVVKWAATKVGINHFSYAYGPEVGKVTFTIQRAGKTVLKGVGAAISTTCPKNTGVTNYNAWVGSA